MWTGRLSLSDGKEGLGDHGAQHRLGESEAVDLVHGGQLGELLRVGAQDVEFREAALDVDHIAVGGEDHHVVGHFPDDLPEQAGGQDQGPLFRDLRGDGGLNTGLQIVASEAELAARLDENALHGGDGALGGYRPGGDGHRRGEQGLLTGKFHEDTSSRFLSQVGRG